MKRIGVFALIRNRSKKVLLVKQKGGKRSWTLPGGRLRQGERILDGLAREVAEETGLKIAMQELAVVINREHQNYLVLIFNCRVTGRTRRRPGPRHPEIEAMDFYDLKKLPTPLSVQATACLFRLGKVKSGYTPFLELNLP
jgi:ADP-ribose pyrophosphatase YjhB (NUDIX family)